MATTVITDETVTISLRMGATLAMAAIGDGTADIVYTLPGEAQQTDALAGTVGRVYGPYPFGQDFAITATDSVQAVTTFGTLTANAVIQQVDSLPALGAPNVIYQTTTAAYWWNGVAFIAMGSGAGGSFTTLAVSGAATIGGSLTVTGATTPSGAYWQTSAAAAATAGLSAHTTIQSTEAAAVGAGASLMLAGRTGNTTPNYSFGLLKGVKDSAVAEDYSGRVDLLITGAAGANSTVQSWNPDGTTVTGYVEGAEQTAPAAPDANGYRIFAQDNGAGKTQLMVIFGSGAAQEIAIEP